MADLLPVLKSLTVADLQAELKKRGLKKSGNKAALIERLSEYITAHETIVETETSEDHVRLVEEKSNDEVQSTDERKQEIDVDDTDFIKETDQTIEVAKEATETSDGTEKVNDEAINLSERLTEPIHKEEEEETDEVDSNGQTNGRTIDIEEELEPSSEIENEIERTDDFQTSTESNHEVLEDEKASKEITGECNNDNTPDDINNDKIIQEEKPITSILHEDDVLDYEEYDEENENINKGTKETSKQIENNKEKEVFEDEEGEIKDDSKSSSSIVEEQEKIEKPKAKPVMLKKNTVSLTGKNETAEERAARRKRRWGSTTLKNTSVAVDTDSIKKLIPALTVDAADVADKLDYEPDDNTNVDDVIDTTVEDLTDSGKKGRTVKLDSAKKVLLGNKTSKPVVIDVDKDNSVPSTKKPRVSISVDDVDDFEMENKRERSPSPPKNEPSIYLCIKNLVRPFTTGQLKGLIGKSGEIAEDGFWINNIKSVSFVKFVSQDNATATRQALHGLKWPSGNPKVLNVDYAHEDKIFSQTDGRLGEKPKVVVEILDEEETSQPKKKSNRKRSQSGENQSKVEEETPVKQLDELFRKTKATPCIYWIPLTDEEVAKRQAEKLAESSPEVKENRKSPVRRRSPDRRNRSPVRRNRSPVQRSRSTDRRGADNRRNRGWR